MPGSKRLEPAFPWEHLLSVKRDLLPVIWIGVTLPCLSTLVGTGLAYVQVRLLDYT